MKKLSLLIILNFLFTLSLFAEAVSEEAQLSAEPKKTPVSAEPVNEKTPVSAEPVNNEKTPVSVEPINQETQISAEPKKIQEPVEPAESAALGEGAIALLTTPREAKIYVNGKLLGNNTPIVLKLPEGEHHIEIKKAGKQTKNFDIIITDGGVISRKITLLDLQDTSQKSNQALKSNQAFEIGDLKQDAFETEKEFQKRRVQLFKQFNEAVQQKNPDYQAGFVYLKKDSYDIDRQIFPVHIEWLPSWKKTFDLPQSGYITAKRDDAKKLWETGEKKSLYIYVEWGKDKPKAHKVVLIGLEKEWIINFNQDLPTTLFMTWQGNEESISSAAIKPDLSLFASVTDKIIKLWDVNTGKRRHTLNGHEYKVSSVTFSPQGDMLASGSMDSIKLWNVKTGKLITTLGTGLFFTAGHEKAVNSVAFTPDGNYLVSGGADKNVKVWELSTGKVLKTLTGHHGEITSIAITTHEDNILVIASGSQDKTIKLWFNTVPLYTLEGHEDTIQSIAFSPDGKTLASGSRDKTIKLWSVPPTEEPPRTLQMFEDDVVSIAFHPKGEILASISGSQITLWNVKSGEILNTLQQDALAQSVAFSSDGRTLATVGESSNIKVWKSAINDEL
jgi:WD40 repeat protein